VKREVGAFQFGGEHGGCQPRATQRQARLRGLTFQSAEADFAMRCSELHSPEPACPQTEMHPRKACYNCRQLATSIRAQRGDVWNYLTYYLRVANRISNEPTNRYYDLGFRCAQ
jgi:hypothetical protein